MQPTPTSPRQRDDRGAATCEYATGAVGAACIGALLWLLVQQGFFTSIMVSILDTVRLLDDAFAPLPHPFGLM